jgi:tetratricopeptide (TPR) repeat protein
MVEDAPPDEDRDLAFELGNLFYARSRPAEALAWFERSLALHGPDAHVLCNAGTCLLALGRREEALQRMEAALAIDPTLMAALTARIEIQEGDPLDAAPAVARAAAFGHHFARVRVAPSAIARDTAATPGHPRGVPGS